MIRVIHSERAEPDFAQMATRLAELDMQDALARCRAVLLQGVRDYFTSSTTPGGQSWPPRKPRKGDDGHPLLIDTGALLQAATGGGAGHVTRIAARQLEVGVSAASIPYAAVHQFGWSARNIPARTYLGAEKDELDECGKIIADEGLRAFV